MILLKFARLCSQKGVLFLGIEIFIQIRFKLFIIHLFMIVL